MKQNNINEEELNNLLKINNIEDVILGSRIAAKYLGEEWCRKNFNTRTYYSTISIKDTPKWLLFDKFTLLLGNAYIEYKKAISTKYIIPNIIDFRTTKTN